MGILFKKNMKKFEKWEHEYIENLDLSKIEWIKLSMKELRRFLYDNYFDLEESHYVFDKGSSSVPLGLHYLHFNFINDRYSFLLGVVKNNIGKKTIVADIVFLDNEFLFYDQKEPITYISTLEVNSYFRNKGIFKKMCEVLIDFINPNQDIVSTKESEDGRKCQVLKILEEALKKNGFEKEIFLDDYFTNDELHEKLCGSKKVLSKC